MTGKPNETKRDKFVRLAESRTNKIIDTLELLGNCSNTTAYEYTQKDVTQIFQAIEEAVKEAKKKFAAKDVDKESKFKLKS